MLLINKNGPVGWAVSAMICASDTVSIDRIYRRALITLFNVGKDLHLARYAVLLSPLPRLTMTFTGYQRDNFIPAAL